MIIKLMTINKELVMVNPAHITIYKGHPSSFSPECIIVRLACGYELFCPISVLQTLNQHFGVVQ